MIHFISEKRSRRRGVEAIFSTSTEETDVRFIIGVAGVLTGISLWIIVLLSIEAPRLFGASIISSYLSLTLASLGLLFAICGSGICFSFSFLTRSQSIDRAEAEDRVAMAPLNIPSDEKLAMAQTDPISGVDREALRLFTPNLRLGLVAFIQSAILLVLYPGLVEEYKSNRTMQLWISSTFPFASYALNWVAVILSSAILGILAIQFLPRGIFGRMNGNR